MPMQMKLCKVIIINMKNYDYSVTFKNVCQNIKNSISYRYTDFLKNHKTNIYLVLHNLNMRNNKK